MKRLFFIPIVFLILSLFGCGTDARPGYFIDMFRDAEDAEFIVSQTHNKKILYPPELVE